MNNLFSIEGRVNRIKYFGISFPVGLLTYILLNLLSLVLRSIGDNAFVAVIFSNFYSLLISAGIVITAFQAVKRLHDIGLSGALVWLLLIPFFNIFMYLVLLFVRGDDGPNKYGEDPKLGHQVLGKWQAIF